MNLSATTVDMQGKTAFSGSPSQILGMAESPNHITVCICTFRRPQELRCLLDALRAQETQGSFTYSIVIVDNDSEESGRSVVLEFNRDKEIEVSYFVEYICNIAMARNLALSKAKGNFLALIDDDETPAPDWLFKMYDACRYLEVDGVLGPVLPRFETEPPNWLVKAGIYERPRYKTGRKIRWQEARTGNVLMRKQIIDSVNPVFRPEFGSGGEDQDFFQRMTECGYQFSWCDDAPVYETVQTHRWTLHFLLKRALLRGTISSKHRQGRTKNICKALVAVPAYGLALPFLLIGGKHLFLKYLIKMCDHVGRLLAVIKLNPISERNN